MLGKPEPYLSIIVTLHLADKRNHVTALIAITETMPQPIALTPVNLKLLVVWLRRRVLVIWQRTQTSQLVSLAFEFVQ